jgi:hypothetical protein
MFALGHLRRFGDVRVTSALPPIGDVHQKDRQVRKVPRADLTIGNASRRSRSLGDVCAFAWHSAGCLAANQKRHIADARPDYKAPIDPKDVDAIVDYLVSIRGANEA